MMLRAGPCQEAAGRVSHPARAGKRRAGDANAINLSKPERPRCPPTANIYTAPDYAPRALNNTASARPAVAFKGSNKLEILLKYRRDAINGDVPCDALIKTSLIRAAQKAARRATPLA